MKLSNTMMINEKLLPTGKRAFTLAEVLITLSILGVVAALTIPTLVNRQSDLAAQTRIRKAVSAYEDMAAIYMAENDAARVDEACAGLSDYFKQVNGGGTCDFTTADGVRWVFGGDAAASDPGNQGNVIVYDSANAPRYAVVMWAKAGEANGTGNNNGGNARGPVAAELPAVPNGQAAPLHGYFTSNDFMNLTSAQLQDIDAQAQGYHATPAAAAGIAGN